jgi:hypothetical protein
MLPILAAQQESVKIQSKPVTFQKVQQDKQHELISLPYITDY